MRIIHMTHHDLDGAGCAIAIKHLFNRHLQLGKVQVETIGYIDTKQFIFNNLSIHKDEDLLLIVSDVRVETEVLNSILSTFPNVRKFLYVDHHERVDDRKGLEGIKYLQKGRFDYRWRKGHAAAKLCYEIAREQGASNSSEMEKLIKCIDAYDEWKIEEQPFREGYRLNEVFWEMGFFPFYDKFNEGLKWDDDALEIVERKLKEQDDYFNSNKKYIHTIELANDRKLLMSFDPRGLFTNLYTLRYDASLYFIFGKDKDGLLKFSFRVRDSYFDANQICMTLSEAYKGVSGGGHKGAAGIVFPKSYTFEDIFDMVMETLEKLYKI